MRLFAIIILVSQAVFAGITENQAAFAQEIESQLKSAGVRAIADLRNEKISYKIREHSLQKLPYQLIVGDKEVAARQVAVRTRKGEDLGRMALQDFILKVHDDVARRVG